MAGNNSLQMLRGSSSAISASTATLLAGQPLYDMTNNLLYVGDGSTTQIKDKYPIYAYGLKDKSGSLLIYDNVSQITVNKRIASNQPIGVGPAMGAVELTTTGIQRNNTLSALNFTCGSGPVHIGANGDYTSIDLNNNEVKLTANSAAGIVLSPGAMGITLGGSTINVNSGANFLSTGDIILKSQSTSVNNFSYLETRLDGISLINTIEDSYKNGISVTGTGIYMTVHDEFDYLGWDENGFRIQVSATANNDEWVSFDAGGGEVNLIATGSTLVINVHEMFIEAKGCTYELPEQGGKFAMVSNYSNGDLYLVG